MLYENFLGSLREGPGYIHQSNVQGTIAAWFYMCCTKSTKLESELEDSSWSFNSASMSNVDDRNIHRLMPYVE